MKKIIIILLLPLKTFAQGGLDAASCIDFYNKNIAEINKGQEYSKKSFYSTYYTCFEKALNDPKLNNDVTVYKAFIAACYYGQSWKFAKGAEAYLKAVENKIELDSTTKALSLFCWANYNTAWILPTDKKIMGDATISKFNNFFILFDEMILRDKAFICLRTRIYNKLQTCYKQRNDTMYSKYNLLYNEDERYCNGYYTFKTNNEAQIISIKSK